MSSAVKNQARTHDVVLELGHQGFDSVETALAAQEVSERHPAKLAVEIPVEIDQVGFEQGMLSVEVERRAPPDVYRTGVARPVGAL